MKKIELLVTLKFDENVSQKNIQELLENVAESLEHTADTKGLAPEASQTYTTHIEVADLNMKHKPVVYKIKQGSFQKL